VKVYLIRKGDTFAPLSVEDADRMKRIKEGGIILVDYKKPRNPLFHNKFMSMVRTVFDNQEQYANIENLLNVLKVELGHYDTMFYRDLKIRIPRSISFAKMDEIEFSAFYDRAVSCCLSHFLPQTTPEELEEYVAQILRYNG
jgi:Protein of unknown function (DUF1367)